MTFATFLLFGAVGGLARGFVGALKSFRPVGAKRSLDMKKLWINILGSMAIGAVVGLLVDINPIVACTAGYAGIDIIETIIKTKR